MKSFAVFHSLRRALRTAIARIERTFTPHEHEAVPDPELEAQKERELERQARRASRLPWYYRRPQPIRVPDSLRYHEDAHGTKATLEMLAARARKLESEER